METSWKITQEKIDAASAGVGTVFLQPREALRLVYDNGIFDLLDAVTFVAIGRAESLLGVNAWHDNLDAAGNVLSRDVGWLQINIPKDAIGTQRETDLHDPVKNVQAAIRLFNTSVGGDIRRFQPWAAYNSGVYLHDPYAGMAALAACNFMCDVYNRNGATLPLPLFSTKDLRAKLAAST